MGLNDSGEGREKAPERPSEGASADAAEPAGAASVVQQAPAPEEEDVWKEDYEEHIDAEPEPEPKPGKRKGKGRAAAVVTVVVLLLLVVWTVASPEILPRSGEAYTDSDVYANLGSYVGWRANWAANTTWGICVYGDNTTRAGEVLNISVLVTKVEERTGNWFLRGSAISLRNVSVYTGDGVFVGAMSNWTDVGFGQAATVPLVFQEPGTYDLFVYVKFMVFIDMRIGFLPVEAIEVPQVYLDAPIVVV